MNINNSAVLRDGYTILRRFIKMEDNKIYCSHCGALIDEDEDYEEINGEIVCTSC